MNETENRPNSLSSVASMNVKITMKMEDNEETLALFRESVQEKPTEVSCVASNTTKICGKLEDPEGTFAFLSDLEKKPQKESQTFHEDVKK